MPTVGLLARGSPPDRLAFPVSQWHAMARARRLQLRGQPRDTPERHRVPCYSAGAEPSAARVSGRKIQCKLEPAKPLLLIERRSQGFADQERHYEER